MLIVNSDVTTMGKRHMLFYVKSFQTASLLLIAFVTNMEGKPMNSSKETSDVGVCEECGGHTVPDEDGEPWCADCLAFGKPNIGYEIIQLPYSEPTQKLIEMAKEMRESMDREFNLTYSRTLRPREEDIMRHKRQIEENMRGVMAQLCKAVAMECPAVMITLKEGELNCEEISHKEFYIQPEETCNE